VQLDSVTPDGNLFPGDYYRWSYSVTIGNGDVVCVSASNCFFTIYDFWAYLYCIGCLECKVGVVGIYSHRSNSHRQSHGTQYHFLIVGIGQTITGFNVCSTLGNIVATGQYSWQDPNASALIQNGLGEVGVPSATSSPVPEPSTMLLLGSGLLGVLGFRGRFRKQVK